MALVPRSLNEIQFKRGQDPLRTMDVGRKAKILNALKKLGMDEKDIIIHPSFMITPSKNLPHYKLDNIKKLAIKYMPEKYSSFVKSINDPAYNASKAVEDAIGSGLSPDEVWALSTYAKGGIAGDIKIALAKATRDAEKIKEEEENNIYIFIGYTDKVPVSIGGKKYYEDKFVVENMIKVDKYNPSDLAQVTGMKLRARYQSDKISSYAVYMLTIPKELMDEDNYYEIPEHLQDIVEKYKVRI